MFRSRKYPHPSEALRRENHWLYLIPRFQQEIGNSWRIRPSLNSVFGVIWLSRCLQSSPLLYHQLHLQPSLHYEQPSVPFNKKKTTPTHPFQALVPLQKGTLELNSNIWCRKSPIFPGLQRSPKDVQLHKVTPNRDGPRSNCSCSSDPSDRIRWALPPHKAQFFSCLFGLA